ncbi:MAG TPA: NFACT family protein [Candidatus Anaerostipes excrementavium]|uniref:Rqc2 homolog RqcH n=1 Tax=Candidatus Anaerostipes excrementavium TaxID=2838463 RepID=A0A9D2B8D6_9FIRM|nr:NFACT RNA binding domain-containing protein [uncultured Anaerostipes sp.]HIX66748.1 NFACT family protein [Candidatus Anaerostipes excrementavium]
MAFDGFVISNIVTELNQKILGGRIYKIYQPEADEITLVIKKERNTLRLHISASASLPLIYLTDTSKTNPMQAPNFCMLLRKHLSNGRIVSISQPNFERIIEITIEHLDELGDLCQKRLIVELMGKHSNIIFADSEDMILDSIKHISANISSIREVLPGRTYCFPPSKGKHTIFALTPEIFSNEVIQKPTSLSKALYSSITGMSPLIANEICYRAGLDGSASTDSLTEEYASGLYGQLMKLKTSIEMKDYHPNVIYYGEEPKEFSCIPLTSYSDGTSKTFPSIFDVLICYYAEKEKYTRMKQKTADLRKIVQTAQERVSKKYDLQQKQLKDTKKREKYKVYGELIQTYGYQLEPNAKSLTCVNYYTNEEITIPLDPNKTPLENSQKYFARYSKLKRTYEALSQLVVETKADLDHLESIATSLSLSEDEKDLALIKEELIDYGYIKSRGNQRTKRQKKSKPLHFLSSDGFHMYVGKNNYQNDELTFKFANGGDWWFHAKQMPGSHVIVRKEQAETLPDATFEEAGRLAAYYSKGRQAPKVEIDYVQRKELKKPPKAKPGFVIYHTNYSMMCRPDISDIKEL